MKTAIISWIMIMSSFDYHKLYNKDIWGRGVQIFSQMNMRSVWYVPFKLLGERLFYKHSKALNALILDFYKLKI